MTKLEKFMFNQHIFDEPEEEEEVLEEPPAPTFSEEELEEARRTAYEQAFQKGREEALEEAKNSRGQLIANVLQKISTDTGLLFAAEDERDTVFEEEVIRVCMTIFDKLYPVMMEQFGEAQMRAILQDVLRMQDGKSEILVETAPEAAEGVEAFLQKLALTNNAQERLVVKGSENIGPNACALQWKDGGAVRDGEALASQARDILLKALGGNKSEESPENTHEIQPNDAIMDEQDADSTALDNEINNEDNPPIEELEKPDE